MFPGGVRLPAQYSDDVVCVVHGRTSHEAWIHAYGRTSHEAWIHAYTALHIKGVMPDDAYDALMEAQTKVAEVLRRRARCWRPARACGQALAPRRALSGAHIYDSYVRYVQNPVHEPNGG